MLQETGRSRLESRLALASQALQQAVEEINRVLAEIRAEQQGGGGGREPAGGGTDPGQPHPGAE